MGSNRIRWIWTHLRHNSDSMNVIGVHPVRRRSWMKTNRVHGFGGVSVVCSNPTNPIGSHRGPMSIFRLPFTGPITVCSFGHIIYRENYALEHKELHCFNKNPIIWACLWGISSGIMKLLTIIVVRLMRVLKRGDSFLGGNRCVIYK